MVYCSSTLQIATKIMRKSLTKIWQRDLIAHTDFVTKILTDFDVSKKCFILMTIWTVGRDLMKHHYWIKNNFILT